MQQSCPAVAGFMTTFAIDAQGLSKAYRIGQRETHQETLVGTLAGVMKAPLANLKRLRSLTSIDPDDQESDGVVWALRDVDFRLKQGESLGIIGRNGAGKTTLLRLLSGITEPTLGKATVRGRTVSLLEIGTGFHPDLTGRENVYLNGTILGMRKHEVDRSFDEIVAFAEVDRFIDTPIKWYSSGMAVRLAFSVAAHLQADILLVDEVLAVGDASFQKKCLGRMGSLTSTGRAALFVSHNMAAITHLCSEAIWLEGGRLVARGKSEEIVSEYLRGGHVAGERDISEAPRRAITDRPLMRRVRLTSGSQKTAVIQSGGPLEMEIELDYEPTKTRALSVGFQIVDERGYNVLGSNSAQYQLPVVEGNGPGTVRASIEALPLAPGTYSVSLFLDNGLTTYEIVAGAISFEVIWPAGREMPGPPQKVWGPLSIPVRWGVRPKGSGPGSGDRNS